MLDPDSNRLAYLDRIHNYNLPPRNDGFLIVAMQTAYTHQEAGPPLTA